MRNETIGVIYGYGDFCVRLERRMPFVHRRPITSYGLIWFHFAPLRDVDLRAKGRPGEEPTGVPHAAGTWLEALSSPLQ